MEVFYVAAYTPFFVRRDQLAGAYVEGATRTSQTLVLLMVNSSTPVRLTMAGPSSANSVFQGLRQWMEAGS